MVLRTLHKDRLVQVVRIDKGPKIIVRDMVSNIQNERNDTISGHQNRVTDMN